MNYRHHFHAGNFADVVKHVVLGLLLQAMSRKEKGFLFLDTHAGRGRYDLEAAIRGDTLARQPEWPAGLGRLLERADAPVAVQAYLAAVRAFDRRSGNLGTTLRFYPGSPWLARGWTRPQDRLALCELNPQECAALKSDFQAERKVSVHEMDGYVAIRAMLPPLEKRALVLVDPPFESPAEWASLLKAFNEGLRWMPAATFAFWYPLTERAQADRFAEELAASKPPPTWRVEVTVAGEMSDLKMRGCGLIVVNPPWQLEQEVEPVALWLADALAQAPGGEGRLQWLMKE